MSEYVICENDEEYAKTIESVYKKSETKKINGLTTYYVEGFYFFSDDSEYKIPFYGYIFAMALTTYLIRMLPMILMRKPIRSRFVKSFLYYVPYVCLSAMTFPSILSSTESVISAAAALVTAVVLAVQGKSLIIVAVASGTAVFLVERILAFF